MTFRDEAFFQAIQQFPDDDLPRLILADFLDERDDPADNARAELIRVQIELANLQPNSLHAPTLVERQDALLAEWERVWLDDAAEILDGWTFRRGMVEAVRVDASVFLERAAEWFAAWPTLSVAKLTRAAGHLGELAECPWLAHLRGLDLSDNDIDADTLAPLMRSRFLCLLRGLDLGGNPLGARGTAMIASAKWADELDELHLSRCRLRGDGLAELLGKRSTQWRRLDLSGNELFRRDLVRLVESPTMPDLVSLDLASNPLGEHGASVLADASSVGGLIDLGLCDTMVGNAELTALAESRHLKKLRSLDLRRQQSSIVWDDVAKIDRGGIGVLSRSMLLGQLNRFLLGSTKHGNGWTDDALRPARLPRRSTVEPGGWIATRLRDSKCLMPSNLIECDLEELWWLGDIRERERVPSPYDGWQYDPNGR